MRVHPSNLSSASATWQVIAAGVVLVVLVLFKFGGDKTSGANAAGVGRPRLEAVVVAKNTLSAGDLIRSEDLVIEKRQADTLPIDPIKTIEEASGLAASGPIPAGYVLARVLVRPAEIKSAADEGIEIAERRLAQIREKTVAMVVPLSSAAPARGSRLALSLQGRSGRTALVADEAWLEDVTAAGARIRVAPGTALFLEEAKSFGAFSFLELSAEGESPFKGQALTDIFELKQRLVEAPAPEQAAKSEPAREERKPEQAFSSFAWTPGSKEVYAVNSEGRIHRIEQGGTARPLYEYKFDLPAGTEGAPVRSREQPRRSVSRLRTEKGLN